MTPSHDLGSWASSPSTPVYRASAGHRHGRFLENAASAKSLTAKQHAPVALRPRTSHACNRQASNTKPAEQALSLLKPLHQSSAREARHRSGNADHHGLDSIRACAAGSLCKSSGSTKYVAPVLSSRPDTLTAAVELISEDGKGYLLLMYAAFSDAAYCPYNFDFIMPNALCDVTTSDCMFLQRVETVHEFTVKNYVAGNIAVSHSLRTIVISFRGTASAWDFFTDVRYLQVPAWALCRRCLIHHGFLRAFDNIRADLVKTVLAQRNKHDYRIVVTGHLLGSAVANIAAAYLRKQKIGCDLYTYGSPRVGDRRFADFVSNQRNGITARVTSRYDPVTVIPSTLLNFRHVYPEYWFPAGFGEEPLIKCDGPERGNCSGQIPSALLNLPRRIPMHSDYWAKSNPCPAYRDHEVAELEVGKKGGIKQEAS